MAGLIDLKGPANPGLVDLVSFRSSAEHTLAGLRPGRYDFVVIPDDVVLDPPPIDVDP